MIRAIDDRSDCALDETESFTTVTGGFVVEHCPLCSGLTVRRNLDSDG